MTYRNSYPRDPYWLTAKFSSPCKGCGQTVTKGARAFYYPREKAIYGASCGCAESRANDFAAAVFDEASYNGSW